QVVTPDIVAETKWFKSPYVGVGSTTVSDTFGDGTTENVFIILSGYSSRIFEISRVPNPDPVPPPSECFGAFCVVAFGPVISCSALSKDKVVWPENLSEWTRTDGVHGARLEINEHGSGHVLPTAVSPNPRDMFQWDQCRAHRK
ncbi:hypothetical protein HUJ04_004844, partial [Dendroctonus ponderosae]